MTTQLIDAAKALLAEMWVIPGGAFANSRLIENRHLYALRAAVEAAEKQSVQEPVSHEYRVWHSEDTVSSGWGSWTRCRDASERAAIKDYLDRGYRYQLRALYAAPVAQEAKPLSDEDIYKVFRKESLHHESWPGFKAGWKAAHGIGAKK